MRLATAEQARHALARQMNLYKSGDIEADVFARLRPAFSILLDYFKFQKDMEIEARLDAIEEKLNMKEKTDEEL